MRHIILLSFVTVFFLIAGNGYTSESVEDNGQELSFKWAIILVDNKGERGTLSITKNTTIFSGDSLSIFIQPEEKAYVYLYLIDSGDKLQMLFPASIEDFDDNYGFGKGYRIPGKGRWLTIDQHKGTETFFLLASAERNRHLESLTMEHKNASGHSRETAKRKVVSEIKNVKRRLSRLTTIAEKPIPIMGTMRGSGESEEISISSYAMDVKATNFYSKTIRLEHK